MPQALFRRDPKHALKHSPPAALVRVQGLAQFLVRVAGKVPRWIAFMSSSLPGPPTRPRAGSGWPRVNPFRMSRPASRVARSRVPSLLSLDLGHGARSADIDHHSAQRPAHKRQTSTVSTAQARGERPCARTREAVGSVGCDWPSQFGRQASTHLHGSSSLSSGFRRLLPHVLAQRA